MQNPTYQDCLREGNEVEQTWSRDRLSPEGGSSELETGVTTTISSVSSDLAKLNPKCHMNYSNCL